MIETFTEETFLELLNARFRIHPEGGDALELELVKVTSLSSLILFNSRFSFTARRVSLPQRIYRLEHEQLGEFDLFLVPIGKTSTGFQVRGRLQPLR